MKNYKRLSDEVLRKKLNEISYKVTRQNATEKPFSSPYNKNFADGLYVDIASGEPLFLSKDKFDSGCGWPAFSNTVDDEAVREFADNSFGIERVEVRSRYANSHLGHVFEDGPKEFGGRRFCINGAALKFIPKENLERLGYAEFLKYFKS